MKGISPTTQVFNQVKSKFKEKSNQFITKSTVLFPNFSMSVVINKTLQRLV